MMLTRNEIVDGLMEAYDCFARLVDDLNVAQWRTPTRCTGWEVRDVAGHVIGQAGEVVDGTIGQHTPDEQARRHRDSEPAALAQLLREVAPDIGGFLRALDDETWAAPSGVGEMTIGEGIHTMWYDAYVHADDIRAALGLPAERGNGLSASVAFLRRRLQRDGWGPARLALDGMPELDIGAGGPVLRGDPLRFVLVASGRADPAELGLDDSVNIYRR